MSTLHIRDLSSGKELDGQAMAAVHGGQDDQAIGSGQSNVQSVAATASVGNGARYVAGPANIQSDTTFSQSNHNSNAAWNLGFGLFFGWGVPVLR
jgi:hypothetical protein